MTYESMATARAEIPSKGTRLSEIFRVVAESKPANNPLEAHQLIEKGFHSTENSLNPQARMEVLPFEQMDSFESSRQDILFSNYNAHTLFIAQNGAIDIRKIDWKIPPTKKLFDKDPKFPYTQMEQIFSKPGADGNNVFPEEKMQSE